MGWGGIPLLLPMFAILNIHGESTLAHQSCKFRTIKEIIGLKTPRNGKRNLIVYYVIALFCSRFWSYPDLRITSLYNIQY